MLKEHTALVFIYPIDRRADFCEASCWASLAAAAGRRGEAGGWGDAPAAADDAELVEAERKRRGAGVARLDHEELLRGAGAGAGAEAVGGAGAGAAEAAGEAQRGLDLHGERVAQQSIAVDLHTTRDGRWE